MLITLLTSGAAGLATDIIVDNADVTGVTITGTWTQATSTYGYWGTNYAHDGNTGKGTKSVRFAPNLPVEGDYDVYLRWTAANDRASNVPVDVVSATGTTTATVNQQLIGAAWVRLTTAHFLAGTSGSVLVRTDATNGFVVADAVRFLIAGAPSNALVESLTPMEPARMLNGLGWNINMDNEWEFQKVKEARGREVRIQFGWESVEATNGTLSLSTRFQNALAWCVKYGLEPIIVAAYGPPRATVTNLTVTANTPAGSYVIPVSGTAALPYTDFTNLGAIVVDNADATGVTVTGTWSTITTGSGYWGSNCLSDQGTGKGTQNVRFTPNLPAAGDYDIYIRWPATGTRSGNVPVDVTTPSGIETIPVAENANAGSWMLLKRAMCAAGTGSSVLIRNDGTTAGELVLADAAAWVPVAATDAPIRGCHVQKSDNSQIVASGKWAYYGALIDSVDPTGATITLAAKTSVALNAGTVLKVNQLRYASAATISATDPAWVAYARYVKYLADQVGTYGLKGRVELWNEPPWPNDSWDHRGGFYDNAPIGSTTTVNYGMQRAVLDHVLPAGVRYSWGGSHKTGTNGVLNAPLPKPTQAQVANAMPTEGWHPYGPTPEWHLWYPDTLLTAPNVFTTGLEGTNGGSNNKQGRRNRANWLASNGWTVVDQISETGHLTSDETARTRWVTRSFLSNLCIGPAPFTDRINFYRLTDTPSGFGMID
ncbi:MAG: hypothetical protein ABIP85_17325, partial [Chthoniobacteraceae bacterium]